MRGARTRWQDGMDELREFIWLEQMEAERELLWQEEWKGIAETNYFKLSGSNGCNLPNTAAHPAWYSTDWKAAQNQQHNPPDQTQWYYHNFNAMLHLSLMCVPLWCVLCAAIPPYYLHALIFVFFVWFASLQFSWIKYSFYMTMRCTSFHPDVAIRHSWKRKSNGITYYIQIKVCEYVYNFTPMQHCFLIFIITLYIDKKKKHIYWLFSQFLQCGVDVLDQITRMYLLCTLEVARSCILQHDVPGVCKCLCSVSGMHRVERY